MKLASPVPPMPASSASRAPLSSVSKSTKEIFAGSIAGITSLIVCYPLDTVRTRLQTSSRSQFNGVVDCFMKTVKTEGALALYKGMASPLAAQALQKAVMFGAYGATQRYIERWATSSSSTSSSSSSSAKHFELTTSQFFLCGMMAGLTNSFVAAPIELVRNRLMVQMNHPSSSSASHQAHHHYNGPIDCARKIIKERGVVGLWKGIGPTIARDGPGVGAWYAAFEWTRRKLTPEGRSPKDAGFFTLLVSGGVGGISYWVTAFPQDTIKSVLQTDKEGRYRGMWDCARQLAREGGVARFYRGFMMGIVRGVPGAAATFATYGLVIRQMD